ncbi:MAG TPA: O-antigen ligase family protein [Blastocatellia bacterium]|nr:O-antigen ligase family protein [Blastocatellia bacterium]
MNEAVTIGTDGGFNPPYAYAKPKPPGISAVVWGVAVLTVFFGAQIIQLFPSLDGVPIAKLTALVVILVFLNSKKHIAERVRLRHVPQLGLILTMFTFAALTVPLAFWPAESWAYLTTFYLKNVVFVYLLVQAAKTDRDSRLIIGALIAGAAALVLAMLANFGPLVTYKTEPGRMAIGDTYDPNDLALLFVVILPFAFFMVKSSKPVVRVLLILSIAILLIGIVLSESRGGFLALIAVALMIFLRASKQAKKYILLTVLLSVGLFRVAAPPSFWARIDTIYRIDGDYNLSDAGGRISIWKIGIKMFARSPITGIGIGCFQDGHAALSESHLAKAAHNSFLQAATELGVPGLGLFIAILISSAIAAARVRSRARAGEIDATFLWFSSALEVSLFGFVVGGFFLSHAYSPIFCFLVGMSASLAARFKGAERHQLTHREVIDYA